MRLRCLSWLVLVGLSLSPGARAEGPSVRLAFVGDVMLDETPGRLIRQGRDPFAPFAAWLNAADVRVANLECVVSLRGSAEPGKPYAFRAHPRVLPVLKRHFDAVGLANNHSGDFGSEAFADMLDRLQAQRLPQFGGGRDLAEAHRPLILERQGLRIALLGYNEFLPRHFEADVDKPGVAWSEDTQVQRDIRLAREQHRADVVIPVMHWGWEYEPLASARQRALARKMIDAGADAVVGGHPHVVQDTEVYQGKPIVYSLGNFVFNGFDHEAMNTGWLLNLVVDRQGAVSWRSVVVRIDREGTPHPDRQAAGMCWQRGQTVSAACPPGGSPSDLHPVSD